MNFQTHETPHSIFWLSSFWLSLGSLLCGWALLAAPVRAQENYEIQVYGSETMEPGRTMIVLHSNFTIKGRKTKDGDLLPTHHAWHETLEITHGFNDWFETGFYLFTSARSGNGWDFVGSHIRPRVRAPEKWKLPVGLSLSAEIGWQNRRYDSNSWSLELRPIVDKDIGKWYLAFNPTLERALHGADVKEGFVFSPNFKVSRALHKKVALGLEYYGGLGPVGNFDRLHDQSQQFIPAIDLFLSDNWEFNFGVGVGATAGTEHLLVKAIVGRRFKFGKH